MHPGSPVARAHEAVSEVLRPGDVALDATAGNGHDTLFLARSVGPEGTVHALDVQAAAITATRKRLEAAGVANRVRLHQLGHQALPDFGRRLLHLHDSLFVALFQAPAQLLRL